jgi:hypothetical protein
MKIICDLLSGIIIRIHIISDEDNTIPVFRVDLFPDRGTVEVAYGDEVHNPVIKDQTKISR